jgi:hypothetical protein
MHIIIIIRLDQFPQQFDGLAFETRNQQADEIRWHEVDTH